MWNNHLLFMILFLCIIKLTFDSIIEVQSSQVYLLSSDYILPIKLRFCKPV